MLDEKYKVTKDQAVTQVSKASTVSLTADMWTSINMDAYLAVTCHFITEEVQLSTILLGVKKIPPVPYCSTHSRGQRHSDGRMGNLRQSKESGHRRSTKYGSMCQSPQCAPHQLFCPHVESGGEKSRTLDLDDIRTKAKRIVAHFKSSTTAKEKLSEIQRLMGRPEHEFLQEVMLQRLYEQREPLGAALTSLNTTLLPLSAEEYDTINQCLSVFSPFHQATEEMSTEKRVSGSKVIPIVKMLKHLAFRRCTSVTHPVASNLVNNIHTNLQEKFAGLEKITSLTLATLLDPRFKQEGFCSTTSCQAAVERLTRECASVIPEPAHPLPPAEGPSHVQSNSLWDLLDSHVDSQHVSNCTASAIAEVQRWSTLTLCFVFIFCRKDNDLRYLFSLLM